MRTLHVTCDRCGAKAETGGDWPAGWYHWHQEDLCHTCAVPIIQAALEECSDPPVDVPHRPDLRWD